MDDLTAKIKEVAGKVTGNDPAEEGRSPADRDREFGADRGGMRDDHRSAGTTPGTGSEPYPPVAPDMTGPEAGPYSRTPTGGAADMDDEDDVPPV